MPRLKVTIGPHRFDMSVAHVNNPQKPTEIDTPLFAGRVVVFVKNFTGVAPEGEQPIHDSDYFDGRSRKFAILIEGRFKRREGVEPYTGEEIQFGSDFDYLPEQFPHGPFNAGMRIAKMVDPATFYEEHPPSGRPFIMSPYVACMNTFCAYPAPNALHRAILVRHHDEAHPHHDGESTEGGVVPIEDIEKDHKHRTERAYWRFIGLQGNPAVDAFVVKHANLLKHKSASSAPSSGAGTPSKRPTIKRLGTIARQDASGQGSGDFDHVGAAAASETGDDGTARSGSPVPQWGAPILSNGSDDAPTPPPKKASKWSLATLTGRGGTSSHASELHEGDMIQGSELHSIAAGVDPQDALGPWRFGDPGVDCIEDSTFVFLDPEHTRTVAQRRKWFCAEGGKHRKEFVYDPDVIYTASFFTNFADLNTLELNMGPVRMSIAKYFTDMPIRYTLRSTRMAPRPDGKEGQEEESFVTIAFELVS